MLGLSSRQTPAAAKLAFNKTVHVVLNNKTKSVTQMVFLFQSKPTINRPSDTASEMFILAVCHTLDDGQSIKKRGGLE